MVEAEKKNTKQLLIVAVDPGTTIGIAMLDLDGNIVKVISSRNLSIEDVIRKIRNYGIPIIITNDKSYLPVYLDKIRTSYKLKPILPKKDLLLKVKQDLLKWYSVKKLEGGKDINQLLSNSHEKDSFASAVFAYRKLYPTINKIEYFIENNDYFRTDDENQNRKRRNFLRKEVLQKDKSIFSVYESMIKFDMKDKDTGREVKPKQREIDVKQKLEEKTQQVKRTETEILKDYIANLKNKISFHKKENRSLRNMITKIMNRESLKEKRDRKLKLKNKELKKSADEVKNISDKFEQQEKRIYDFSKILPDINKYYIVWIAEKITESEIESYLQNSKEDQLLYIKDVNNFSAKAIKELKKKTSIIISSKTNRRIKEDFLIIDASKLKLTPIFDNYYLTNKKKFDKIKNSKNILNRIVRDYKEERQK